MVPSEEPPSRFTDAKVGTETQERGQKRCWDSLALRRGCLISSHGGVSGTAAGGQEAAGDAQETLWKLDGGCSAEWHPVDPQFNA